MPFFFNAIYNHSFSNAIYNHSFSNAILFQMPSIIILFQCHSFSNAIYNHSFSNAIFIRFSFTNTFFYCVSCFFFLFFSFFFCLQLLSFLEFFRKKKRFNLKGLQFLHFFLFSFDLVQRDILQNFRFYLDDFWRSFIGLVLMHLLAWSCTHPTQF